MKNLLINTLDSIGFAWWIEITTDNPNFTYYFGPFLTAKEADHNKYGYLEDLEAEGSKSLSVVIKRCRPDKLTVDHNGGIKTPVFQ